jgi:hypothetical protein
MIQLIRSTLWTSDWGTSSPDSQQKWYQFQKWYWISVRPAARASMRYGARRNIDCAATTSPIAPS